MTLSDTVTHLWDAMVKWKIYGDVTSALVILGSIANWLPSIATLLSIIWVIIRIYETETVQWLLFHRHKHHHHHDDT